MKKKIMLSTIALFIFAPSMCFAEMFAECKADSAAGPIPLRFEADQADKWTLRVDRKNIIKFDTHSKGMNITFRYIKFINGMKIGYQIDLDANRCDGESIGRATIKNTLLSKEKPGPIPFLPASGTYKCDCGVD